MKHFAIVCVCCALICGCAKKSQKAPEQSKAYPLMSIEKSDAVLESRYSATLEGQQLVEIRPQVSGIITEICFNEGDKVSKGQTLFVLDQVPYKAAVEVAEANEKSARAQLATAKLTAESNEMLFKNDVISAYELQTSKNALSSAEAAYAQAKAQVTTAHNNLSYTVVKSPLNGVAGMVPYKVGALVGSNVTTPLVTVSDDDCINAYFSLSENQLLNLMNQYGSQQKFIEGMADVQLLMSNGERFPCSGRIDAVSGIVDQSTGAVRVRAKFANADHLVRSGCSATILIPTVFHNSIVIPQTATFEIQEKHFVYKVIDGKAESGMVEVYKENDGVNYIVLSGLKEADVIIAKGAGLVKEGTVIEESKDER